MSQKTGEKIARNCSNLATVLRRPKIAKKTRPRKSIRTSLIEKNETGNRKERKTEREEKIILFPILASRNLLIKAGQRAWAQVQAQAQGSGRVLIRAREVLLNSSYDIDAYQQLLLV